MEPMACSTEYPTGNHRVTHQHDTTNIMNLVRDGAKDSADAIWQQHSLYLYAMQFLYAV